MPRPTTRNALKQRLRDAASLPEAITVLKDYYGSDDALAERLGTKRQTTIRWRQGTFPEEYVDQLAAEGVPKRLLTPPASVEDVWRIQLRLEAELAALRRLLGALGPEPE